MAKRTPSIKEVAEKAGVSIATVSNVFSGKKAVTPELAGRVRAVATNLGYRTNRSASNLRSGRSRVVAVIVPSLTDPFFTALFTELEGLIQSDGYDVIVANSQESRDVEGQRVAALLSWRPAGIIVVPCSDELPQKLFELRNDLPIVIVDRGARSEVFDSVSIDNVDASAIAAKHLVDLGHHSVLVVASDLSLEPIRDRCRGVVEFLASAGRTAEVIEVGSDPKVGAELLARWLDRNTLPSAIFGVTDITTLATLTCLAEREYEIGDDVSLVGFDDIDWMSARRTPITTVRQPIEEMAESVWAILKKRLEGFDAAPVATILQCDLRVRASSRRVSPIARAIDSKRKRRGA